MSMPDRAVRVCGYLARPVDLFDALELASRVARVPTAIVVAAACVFFARPTTHLMMGVIQQRAANFATTAERVLMPVLCDSGPRAKRVAPVRASSHCRR
jgi:hypothetical protein